MTDQSTHPRHDTTEPSMAGAYILYVIAIAAIVAMQNSVGPMWLTGTVGSTALVGASALLARAGFAE